MGSANADGFRPHDRLTLPSRGSLRGVPQGICLADPTLEDWTAEIGADAVSETATRISLAHLLVLELSRSPEA